MSIPKMAGDVLRYLEKFDLACVARGRDGRLTITRNPEGAEQAYWLAARDAGAVLAKARTDHGDIPRAAATLRVKCVDHGSLMQRTEEIVRRLDVRMKAAQTNGVMRVFNVQYKERRQKAFEQGKNFMGYSAARSRLRAALIETAAGEPPTKLLQRVFEKR